MSMTVKQACHLLEIGSSEDRLEALAIIRAELADMREELDATIEQRDLLSQEVLRLEKYAAIGREIAGAFLPVMEAARPLVLNLERLRDAAIAEESRHD